MRIGLRGGHSINCAGAAGIVHEYGQMQQYYNHVSKLLIEHGHTVINCNSNAATEGGELSEGAAKANAANVDLFISLHMNSYNGEAYGTECLVSSSSSGAYTIAQNICKNFESLGFRNRGVKFEKKYEMNNIRAANIIFEICFCDSKKDMEIYNKYSWDKLARTLCNAIDKNISFEEAEKKGYIITNYLPAAYNGYAGIDINQILKKYFDGVKCYILCNSKGAWIETEYIPLSKCEDLKNTLGSLFYEIKE